MSNQWCFVLQGRCRNQQVRVLQHFAASSQDRLDLGESQHDLLVQRHDGYAIDKRLAYLPVAIGASRAQRPEVQLTDGYDADPRLVRSMSLKCGANLLPSAEKEHTVIGIEKDHDPSGALGGALERSA